MTEPVSFKARVQRYNRVQIPVLARWEHKLEADQVLGVQLQLSGRGFHKSATFYVRMSKDGRLTIPKLIVDIISDELGEKTGEKLRAGEWLSIPLYRPEEEK